MLSVPLMRDGSADGAISSAGRRPDRSRGTDRAASDLRRSGGDRDRERAAVQGNKEALERQTATSDILRVISQSPTDVHPVFDAIVAAAIKLCHSPAANVFTFDGELIHLAAVVNMNPEYLGAIRPAPSKAAWA